MYSHFCGARSRTVLLLLFCLQFSLCRALRPIGMNAALATVESVLER